MKDPGFQSKVNDIVIEFGTRLSQPILDRYINGEEVPPAELQQVWLNTTKVFAFESPIYVVRGRAMIFSRLGAGSGSFVGELFR